MAFDPRTKTTVLIATVVFLLSWVPIQSYDTPWHLAAGEWMVEHRATLDTDRFSLLFRGRPWHSHAPLFDVLLALCVAALGLPGATLLPAAIAASTVAITVWTATDPSSTTREPSPFVVSALTLFATLSVLGVMGARPHTLSFLFIVVSLVALDGLLADRRPRESLAVLVGVGGVWPLVHGSHVMLPLMTGAATLCAWGPTAARWRWVGLTGVIAALGLVLAPGAWTELLGHQRSDFLRTAVGEWKPFSLAIAVHTGPGRAWASVAVLTVVGCAMQRGWMHAARERFALVMGLGGLLLVPAVAVRSLPIALVGLAPAWVGFASTPIERLFRAWSRRHPWRPWLRWFAWASAIASIAAGRMGAPDQAPFGTGFSADRFPEQAVDVLEARMPDARLLHAYNWGGYLMVRGVPRAGVFVDGRAVTLYPPEFLARFVSIYDDASAFEALVEAHAIDAVLLPVRSVRARALVERLRAQPRWRVAYEDTVAVLFVR